MNSRKPENEIYEEVIKYYGIAADSIFFIDDVEANVKAAIEKGMSSHKFENAAGLKQALISEGVNVW